MALAATMLCGYSGTARAAETEIQRGEAIAVGRCIRCHAVGPSDPSPQLVSIPFRELHTRYPIEMLEAARRTGNIAGHDEMPGFDLGLDDVRALLKYIDSLAPNAPSYVPGR